MKWLPTLVDAFCKLFVWPTLKESERCLLLPNEGMEIHNKVTAFLLCECSTLKHLCPLDILLDSVLFAMRKHKEFTFA